MFKITVDVDRNLAIMSGKTVFGRIVWVADDEAIKELSEEQRKELLTNRQGYYLNRENNFWSNPVRRADSKSFRLDLAEFNGIETIKEILDKRIELRNELNTKAEKERIERLNTIVDRVNEQIEAGVEKCISNQHGVWEQPKVFYSNDQRVEVKNFWFIKGSLRESDIRKIKDFDPDTAEEATKMLKEAEALVKENNAKAVDEELAKIHAKALEKQRQQEQNKMFLAFFIDKHCTPSQKERYEANVLSSEELEKQIETILFPPYDQEHCKSSPYRQVPNGKGVQFEIEHDYFCKHKDEEENSIHWEECDATSLTAEEWENLKLLKADLAKKVKDNELFQKGDDPFEFSNKELVGYCNGCEKYSKSVRFCRVVINFAGLELQRDYLL